MSETLVIGDLISRTTKFFEAKQIESPRVDAEVLLANLLKVDRIQLYVSFDKPLEANEISAYREMVKMRSEGTPIAYILETKEFMGYSFKVNPSVLIPRPETEFLVEAGIRYLEKIVDPLILDVCTGSGAILISLLKSLATAKGIGLDISHEALVVAKENGQILDVSERIGFLQGDLLKPAGNRKVHAIFSNPPYIPKSDLSSLQLEVQKEPRLALDGGVDGLDFYRRLLEESHFYLLPKGYLLLEIGVDQAMDIIQIAEKLGWELAEEPIQDYGEVPRVLIFKSKI